MYNTAWLTLYTFPPIRHEHIDWHSKAGITAFHFYDREPSKTHLQEELASVAASFRERNISITYTESVPHTDPIKEVLKVRLDAYQAIANQHCLYHARKGSSWVWLADLDEFVVPLAEADGRLRFDTDARLGFFKDRLGAAVSSRHPNLYAVTIPGTPFTNEKKVPADFNGYIPNFKLRPEEFADKTNIGGRKTVSRSSILERAWIHNAYACQGVTSGPARDQPQKEECMELHVVQHAIDLPLGMIHFQRNAPREFRYHEGPISLLNKSEEGFIELNHKFDLEISSRALSPALSSAGTGSPSRIGLPRTRAALCLLALVSLGWSAFAVASWAGVVSVTVEHGIRLPAKRAACELALDELIDSGVEKRESRSCRRG